MRRYAWAIALMAGGLAGCPTPQAFDDHTVARLESAAQFESLAVTEYGRAATKFTITRFGTPAQKVAFYDAHVFTLHDEWYWFRLLNGQRVDGSDEAPVKGLTLRTVDEVYAWAKEQAVLPLGLQFFDGRLYSPRFYEQALQQNPKVFGAGTLMRVAAAAERPERWGFYLEFGDAPTHEQLMSFVDALQQSLPAELFEQLWWLVRSPAQEQLARTMESQGLRFADRILRFKDLAVPGQTESYGPGLAAGRLRVVRAGEPLSDTTDRDILVLEEVPDYLPPAAGVITAIPQTPLAHFNLLARNRGIPNAYLGGVLDNDQVRELAYYHAPVVVQAVAPDQLTLKPITEAQYAAWQRLLSKPLVAVQAIDSSTLQYMYDLTALSAADADSLVLALGGKAVGYLALLAAARESTVDKVMAISIRPFVEHMAEFKPRIESLLSDPVFVGHPRARYLVLEGTKGYADAFPAPADATFKDELLASRPTGDTLGDVIRGGGLKALVRAKPLDATTRATIDAALRGHFAAYAPSQGLRFRSSSTAEDVEGFNGAGLYDSNTGYLTPSSAPDPNDRSHDVEWALKKTWASYWSYEAFEERRLENVDHLSGNMAVVVHAKFDDEAERANGVFLFTLMPGQASMELNVQAGALSVTNPTTTELPEISRVSLNDHETTPRIERLRSSTVVPAGTVLLDDAQLRETFARAKAVAASVLERQNANRPAAQRASSVLLDFEFRYVAQGWPAFADGSQLPSRIVLKQVRALEPGLRQASDEVKALPLPHDVATHARRVERRSCQAAAVDIFIVEANTDPLVAPDLGYGAVPFTGQLIIAFKQDVPQLGRSANEKVTLTHLQLASTQHGEAGAPWSLGATLASDAAAAERMSSLTIRPDGSVELVAGQTFSAGTATCKAQLLYSTPNEFLLGLL